MKFIFKPFFYLAEEAKSRSVIYSFFQVKEQHKQKEWELASWKNYIKRTSDHSFLVSCKRQQDKSIESSRAKPRYREAQPAATSHETLIKNLNTTVNYYVLAKKNLLKLVLFHLFILNSRENGGGVMLRIAYLDQLGKRQFHILVWKVIFVFK